jgi:RNA polymerase sigma-54 factor
MLKQFLNLKLSQKLSPQQIQLMKLIQLLTQALSNVYLKKWTRILHLNQERKKMNTKKDENEDYDDYDDANQSVLKLKISISTSI